MAVVIRALTSADAAPYRDLRLEMLALHPDAFSSSAQEEARRPLDWSVQRLTPSPDKPHDFFLGAFEGSVLVGSVGLEGRYRAKERHNATIRGMMVRKPWRRQRVGEQLFQALLARARSIDTLHQIDLTVTQGNDTAERMYARAGFAVFGVHPAAIQVAGRYYAKVLMALPLRAIAP